MTFRDLIGQEQVKQLLIESIQTQRIGHAYMFCGPEGIGRKTMARCFAEAISCSTQSVEPCGICSACTLNKGGTNPDIIHIRRQEGKTSVGVEEIRLVQDEIYTAPQFGKYKVIIFENAEKMTVQAQNALLKTLEEPPAYIVMILISSNNSQMLDTVKSRAVKVDFRRYSDSEILKAYTRQNFEAFENRLLCEYADGIIGRAISVTSFSEHKEICEKIVNALINLSKGGGRELCDFENLLAEYAEKKEFFFFTLYSILRDVSVFASYGRKVPLQNAQVANKIYSLSDITGYHKAVKCLELVNKSWRMVGQNVNYKLMADALAIRIQEVFHG